MSIPKDLFDLAKSAREKSYSPYSGFKVGAAIRISGGKIYGGCNVENANYGGSNCAERVAIQNAIAQSGKIEIEEVVVITDTHEPWPPCGFCLQVIAEFSTNPEIYLTNLKGQERSFEFKQLLPEAFKPSHLHQ